jgi:N utilization substance protein A
MNITDLIEANSRGAALQELTAHTATVIETTRDVALLRTSGIGIPAHDVIMPVTEFYVDRTWSVGDVYRVVEFADGPTPLASCVRPELAAALLRGISPEIRTGGVRVMGVARVPGKRCKIAVVPTDDEYDATAACIGRDANRHATLVRLLGERVDIVSWHPERDVFLRNALAPAAVTQVTFDGDTATAWAPAHQMSAAVGQGGLNSVLAGRLVGASVTIEPAD